MIRTILAMVFLIGMLDGLGSVSGIVMVNNSPLPGVQVRLLDAGTQEISAEVSTNRNGAFHFGDVKPGGYFVSFTLPGFREHVNSVTVKDGQVVDIGEQSLVVGPLWEEFYPESSPDSPSRAKEFAHLRNEDGVLIMTVCELLKAKAALSTSRHAYGVLIMGSLIQTDQGNWLQQSCNDSLKSGDFVWPNAVALKQADNGSKRWVNRPRWSEGYIANIVQPTDKKADSSDRGPQWVAAYGVLDTRENLVAAPCGIENRLCGYGYGPLKAPIQLTYDHIYFFKNQ